MKGFLNVAICFEALEHIEDHQKLLSEVKRLLTPEGVFVVSTPNKTVYSDEPQFNNPFHVHELYFDEFRELLETYFKNVKFLGQRIYCNSNIWPVFAGEDTQTVEYVVDKNPKEFVFAGNDQKIPRYFIAIASDAARDIEDRSSALVDVSNVLLNQKDSQISQLSVQKDSQIAAHVREQERLAAEIRQLSTGKDSQIAAHVREQERLAGQIAGYVRQQERLAGQIGQLSAEVQGQGRMLAEGDLLAARLQEEKEKLERDLQKQESQVHESQQSLMKERAAYSALAAQAEAAVEARRKELDEKRKELDEKEALIQQLEAILSHIHSSHGWKALTGYYQLRNKFLPEGTKRREIAKSFWKFLGKSSRFLPAEKNGATVSEAPEITYGGNGLQSARNVKCRAGRSKTSHRRRRCPQRRSDSFNCDSDKECR